MVGALMAAFFLWLIYRELRSKAPKDSMSLGYMGVCLCIAVLCCWGPVTTWLLEKKMTEVVHQLADFKPTKVKCEGVVASIFDSTPMRWAGYANVETGDVVFKAGWCKSMKKYLANPEKADSRTQFSVNLLVHEAMHVRGETDEQRTECQAIQRYYRAAKMLGIPSETAKKHGTLYYTSHYPNHPYFSAVCAPRKKLDEKLPDSLWQYLESV